jgi:hypothetical protein
MPDATKTRDLLNKWAKDEEGSGKNATAAAAVGVVKLIVPKMEVESKTKYFTRAAVHLLQFTCVAARPCPWM